MRGREKGRELERKEFIKRGWEREREREWREKKRNTYERRKKKVEARGREREDWR